MQTLTRNLLMILTGYSSTEIFISKVVHFFSRSTQPGHPFVGRRNEYQPKGSDTLWLGSKGRYGSCLVTGKTV